MWSQKNLVMIIIAGGGGVTTIIIFSTFSIQNGPGLHQCLYLRPMPLPVPVAPVHNPQLMLNGGFIICQTLC